MLTTRTKIAIAKLISKLILFTRRAVGLGPQVKARRGDAMWHLDLREGIDLAVYLGIYERQLRRIAANHLKPGSIALDIGANIGAHTLILAQLVGPHGRVIAFEPTTYALSKLQQNLRLNPELEQRVTVHQTFLTDGQNGSLPDSVYSSWPVSKGTGTVHPIHMGKEMPTTGAHSASIDALLSSGPDRHHVNRLDFIKIDVDGYEIAVLEGAMMTIRRFLPVLLVEFEPSLHSDPQRWSSSWVDILNRLDYELCDPRDYSRIDLTVEGLIEVAPPGVSIDLLAMPRET